MCGTYDNYDENSYNVDREKDNIKINWFCFVCLAQRWRSQQGVQSLNESSPVTIEIILVMIWKAQSLNESSHVILTCTSIS